MAKLCIYLPPFASDYTGICSSLFDLDCLTAINDGSCCTAHYVYWDEPRWEEKVQPVFSTQLRTLDAILGNDEKVIDSVSRMAEGLDISLIALVGTPVPAITGMDMEGIACEIEDHTGICSLGFSTSGFDYYDRGIVSAGKAMICRFTQKTDASEIIPHSVNILGMTPLDYGNTGNDTALKKSLEAAGWKVNGCLFMGTSKAQIENLAKAQVNLAVSAAGLEIAEYLKIRFGTPYAVAAPMGRTAFQALLRELDLAVLHNSCSGAETDSHPKTGAGPELCTRSETNVRPQTADLPGKPDYRFLLVMDQIMGNSLRRTLEQGKIPGQENQKNQADVATFFGWNSSLARENDVHLKSEKDLLKLLRSGQYQTIIGDPMLADMPEMEHLRHIRLTHPAISGQLHREEIPEYLSDQFEEMFQEFS